jgi:hypothetical protein
MGGGRSERGVEPFDMPNLEHNLSPPGNFD